MKYEIEARGSQLCRAEIEIVERGNCRRCAYCHRPGKLLVMVLRQSFTTDDEDIPRVAAAFEQIVQHQLDKIKPQPACELHRQAIADRMFLQVKLQ